MVNYWAYVTLCTLERTEFLCALLQRYKFSSPLLYLATTFLITTYVNGSQYTVESLGNAYAATIQIPGKTRPLYQVTYGSYQIMMTDAVLRTLPKKYAINRILAYLPLFAEDNLATVDLNWRADASIFALGYARWSDEQYSIDGLVRS